MIICLITAGDRIRPTLLRQQSKEEKRESVSAYLFHLLKEEGSAPRVAPIDVGAFVLQGPWIASQGLEKLCDRFLRPTCHNVVTFVWLCSTNYICH